MVLKIRYRVQARQPVAAGAARRPVPTPARRPKVEQAPLTKEEIAGGLASLLSPISALLVAAAIWRLGQDLGFARDFFVQDGPFSHWQVWFALAASVAGMSGWLNRRAKGGSDTPATN